MKGLGKLGDNPPCVFTSGSVDRSSSPQGYRGLPASLSPRLTLFYSAHKRESSLFPNCNSRLLFLPRQYWKDLCPLLSDPEVKHMENISLGRELLEKPGAPFSESR